jgi:hypothetical protein
MMNEGQKVAGVLAVLDQAIAEAEHKPGDWKAKPGTICAPWARFSYARDGQLAMAAVNALPVLMGAVRRQAAPVAVPDGFLLVTPEQLERHATTAGELPQQCQVVLVSALKRLHDKNMLAAAPGAPVQVEPVAWEYRTFYGENTVTPGWGQWERVEPRNRYTGETVATRVAEIQDFISRGYRYELRALYAGTHAAEQPDSVKVPPNCRQRLSSEAKPFPRSSCAVCGQFSPKWRECDALLAGGEA